MAESGGGGGKAIVLLVLLAALGGYGTWNYQRNVAAEKAAPRPFASYSDADIAALVQAYEQEIEVYQQRWEKASGQSVSVRDSGHTDQRVREFERVQGIARQKRALSSELAKRQVALGQLSAEQAKRAEEKQQVVLRFLKRAFVPPA
jgi:hypothetical protein